MIRTERLVLRMAADEEMRALIAAQTDEGLKQAYTEMLEGCLAHPEQRAWYAVWRIELPDGTSVGDYSFKGLSADGMVEIGYGIEPAYQNRGFATEAVTAAASWAAAQPSVTRVEAETDAENAASQRVLAKAGFVPTGLMGEEGPRFEWKGMSE